MLKKQLDEDAIRIIAGFVAYVASCAPAAQRIGAALLKAQVEVTAKVADRMGLFDDAGPMPAEIGTGSIEKLFESGKLFAKVDEKYPQALGIDGLMLRVSRFGNAHWEVFFNPFTDSPFFTSDFPTAMEASLDPTVEHRVVPLAPDVVVRIWPDRSFTPSIPLSFKNNPVTYRNASLKDVVTLNQTIVRSAEDLVFFSHDAAWVRKFLARNQAYGLESQSREVLIGKRTLLASLVSTMKRIVRTK